MDISANIQLPSVLAHKIFLMAIETGHAKCMQQYWVEQHKNRFSIVLKDFSLKVQIFNVCHPFTNEFREGYDSQDEKDYCPVCEGGEGDICYDCSYNDEKYFYYN